MGLTQCNPNREQKAQKGGPVSPNSLLEALGRQVSAWRNACPRARSPADASTRARQGLRRGADVSQSARCRSHAAAALVGGGTVLRARRGMPSRCGRSSASSRISSPKSELAHANHGRVKEAASSLWNQVTVGLG